MFSTIRYRNPSQPDDIPKSVDSHNFERRRPSRLACVECRTRKVKCTGENTGCQRCQGVGITCIYPEVTKRNSKRQRSTAPAEGCEGHPSRLCSEDSHIKEEKSTSSGSSRVPPSGLSAPPNSDASMSLSISPEDYSIHCPDVDGDFSIDFDYLQSFGELYQPGTFEGLSFSLTGETVASENGDNLYSNNVAVIHEAEQCQCAQAAMNMLEELDLKYHDNIQLPSGAILSHQKSALTQLNSWIACSHRGIPRATTKVVILVIECLSLCLERGFTHCTRQMHQNMEDKSPLEPGSCQTGDYQVESTHEWAHIVRVSLLIRCRELLNAAGRLKERGGQGRQLSEAEERLSGVIKELKRWDGCL
ncbi:hypothetical protein QQS21_004205 [Conoideocrella luteorostrata]|uniref:Zn(2)-C6 fungal-type domain-containing protein n=1 Tax=Conoideocrella luteorostrata TaxID=1105319 RepID=A0AAJ0FUW7_9HYPO|nr:hypothetical protein QQS21_004205 [Conoideocrella luteorostrata]